MGINYMRKQKLKLKKCINCRTFLPLDMFIYRTNCFSASAQKKCVECFQESKWEESLIIQEQMLVRSIYVAKMKAEKKGKWKKEHDSTLIPVKVLAKWGNDYYVSAGIKETALNFFIPDILTETPTQTES